MINIIFNLRQLADLRAAMLFLSRDNTALMEDIGFYLLMDTKKSFAGEKSPYGRKWAKLTDTTLGNRQNINNPILRDTGVLARSFRYNARPNNVEVGSNCIYAATQQFGAKRGQYGSMRNGSPIPWGDIPARQILPIANNRLTLTFTQKKDIRQIVDAYIARGLSGGIL